RLIYRAQMYDGVDFSVTEDSKIFETILFDESLSQECAWQRYVDALSTPMTDDMWAKIKDNTTLTRKQCLNYWASLGRPERAILAGTSIRDGKYLLFLRRVDVGKHGDPPDVQARGRRIFR